MQAGVGARQGFLVTQSGTGVDVRVRSFACGGPEAGPGIPHVCYCMLLFEHFAACWMDLR